MSSGKLTRLLRHDWPLHAVLVLTNWLPDNVVFLRLRGALARRFLGSCGRDLRIGRNVIFYNPSSIHLGERVYIAPGCWFMAAERITVGDEVLFGPYCVVVSANHTRIGRSFRDGPVEVAPVEIGSGCWLAAHVVVTAGASIGGGSLVAAQGVVAGEVPGDSLVAGQPVRKVRDL